MSNEVIVRRTERDPARKTPRQGTARSGEELVVAVDLGGTSVTVAAVTPSGEIVERIERPTRAEEGPDAVKWRTASMIEEIRGQHRQLETAAIGVGVAGQVDPRDGRVRRAPNLDWQDVPLAEDLARWLGSPVTVMNDVQAATWGEWVHGAGRGQEYLLCLFVGTGVGGGAVSGGRMLTGADHIAGEFGHLVVERDGPVCSCGHRGCLEAIAGGWAIGRQARASVAADPAAGAGLLQTADGAIDEVTAVGVSRAFQHGDPLAGRIVDRVSRALGSGLVSLVHAFNPRRVIFGGGVIEGLPDLIDRTRRYVRRHGLEAATRALEVVPAGLGSDGPVIGVAARLHRSRATHE